MIRQYRGRPMTVTIPKTIKGKPNPHVEGKVYKGPGPLCNEHIINVGDGETVTCGCGRTITATWDAHAFYGSVLHLEVTDVPDTD